MSRRNLASQHTRLFSSETCIECLVPVSLEKGVNNPCWAAGEGLSGLALVALPEDLDSSHTEAHSHVTPVPGNLTPSTGSEHMWCIDIHTLIKQFPFKTVLVGELERWLSLEH